MNEKNIGSALVVLGLFLIWVYRKRIGEQFLIILGERVVISGSLETIKSDSTDSKNGYSIEILEDFEEKDVRVEISQEDYEKISPRFQKEKLYVVVFCKSEDRKLIALDFQMIEKYIEIK